MFRWTRVLSKSSRLFFLLWTEPCLNVSGICRSVQESSCACCRLKINKYQIKIYNLGNVSCKKNYTVEKRCMWLSAAATSVSRDALVTQRGETRSESHLGSRSGLSGFAFFQTLCKGNTEALQPQTIKGQVTCSGTRLMYIIKEMDAKYSCNHDILLNLDFKMSELNTVIFFLRIHELNF